jgi:hypothetical protein
VAFSVHIRASQSKRPYGIEIPWWNARALMQDTRFIPKESDGYLDYTAVMTVEEAKELRDRFQPAEGSSWTMGGWPDQVAEISRELDRLLRTAKNVEVQVSEWESGLG